MRATRTPCATPTFSSLLLAGGSPTSGSPSSAVALTAAALGPLMVGAGAAQGVAAPCMEAVVGALRSGAELGLGLRLEAWAQGRGGVGVGAGPGSGSELRGL